MVEQYKFYIVFHDSDLYPEQTEPFELKEKWDANYAKFDGLLEDGEITNIYTEEYAESPRLRLYIPEPDKLTHKATDCTLTLLWKLNMPDTMHRNLLLHSDRVYETRRTSSEFDWVTTFRELETTMDLVKGQTYTIRAKSDGNWTNVHDTTQESDNVTLWLTSVEHGSQSGWYQRVSDENTGTANGTTFIFRGNTGKYNIRFNSYGKVKTLTDIMLVKGGKIAKEYETAPEEWESVTEQEQKFYNDVVGRLIEYHDTFRNRYWELLLTKQPKVDGEHLYGGQRYREVSYTFTNVYGKSFTESQIGKIDLYDFGSKEIK